MVRQFRVGQKVRCIDKIIDGGRLYNITGTILTTPETDPNSTMMIVRFEDPHYLRWFPNGCAMFASELQACDPAEEQEYQRKWQEYQRKLADQKRREEHADRYL